MRVIEFAIHRAHPAVTPSPEALAQIASGLFLGVSETATVRTTARSVTPPHLAPKDGQLRLPLAMIAYD
jgi:hypothetical protein